MFAAKSTFFVKSLRNYFVLCVLGTISIAVMNGCSSDGGDAPQSGNTGNPETRPTYYTDVVEPVFYQSCVACHVSGGIAPFSLVREENGYNNAVTYRSLIKQLMKDQQMPPFLASNDGSCQSFKHENAASSADIQAVSKWVDNVKLTSDVDLSAPAPSLGVKPGISTPDSTIDMGGNYTVDPNTLDDYRCFVVDAGFSEDKLLTAYEVLPGNPGIVHHVVLFNLTDSSLVSALEDKDSSEPGLGYTCFGDANFGKSAFVAAWAPGTGATFFPKNTGIRLNANSRLILQVHYNTLNATGNYTDNTRVKLQYTAAGALGTNANEALLVPHNVVNFSLTAAGPSVTDIWDVPNEPNLSQLPSTVYIHGVFPHMHRYGKSLSATKLSPDGDACMVNVKQWDFDWQRFYFYDNGPVAFNTRTDKFEISCNYSIPAMDSLGQPLTINWGNGSGDEMCLNFYYATLKP